MNATNIITPEVPHFDEIYSNEIKERDGRTRRKIFYRK